MHKTALCCRDGACPVSYAAGDATSRVSTKYPYKSPLERGLGINRSLLAVAGDGSHLAGQEVVGRPGTGHEELAVLELLGSRAVAVLILFDRLGVDEVGDIEQHSVGIHLLAADFFLEGVEELVHLDGEGASFGLALALSGRLLAQLDQVLAADGIGQHDLVHGTSWRTVANDQLDAHL